MKKAVKRERRGATQPQSIAIRRNQTRRNSAAISRNQPQSTSISLNQPQSASISRNQPQSTSISLNQPQSATISFNQPQSAAISRKQPQSAAIGGPSHLRAGRADGLVRGPRPLERACISIFGRGAPLGRAAREAAPRAHPPDERCHQRNQWVLISANQRSSSSSPST